jgi:hypothetical protein
MEQPRDEKLWRIARRRAEFRKSLYSYIFVNGFFWAIWWFTTGRLGNFGFPWPVWVMLGWGVGLAKQYYDAYHGDKEFVAEKEYEKLKRKHGL